MWNVPKTLILINCHVIQCFKVLIQNKLFLLLLFFYMYLKINKIFMTINKILGSRTAFVIQMQIYTIYLFVCMHTNTNNIWVSIQTYTRAHTCMHNVELIHQTIFQYILPPSFRAQHINKQKLFYMEIDAKARCQKNK